MWDKELIDGVATQAKTDPALLGKLIDACAPLISMRCPGTMFVGTLCEQAEAPGLAAMQIGRALEWWSPEKSSFSGLVWRYAPHWVARQLKRGRHRCSDGVCLSAPAADDSEDTVGDMLEDEGAADPSACDFSPRLHVVPLHVLKPKTRSVVERYFGLCGRSPETLAAIGPTHQAAQNLLRHGLKKLRLHMSNDTDRPILPLPRPTK